MKEEFNEEATQVSNVDAGRISVFGSDGGNKFKEDNWYDQLFELKDYDENNEELKVDTIKTLDTGGHTMVECGRLKNGNYFVINEDTLVITDADYEEAFEQPEIDMKEWFNEHEINTYNVDFDDEYNIVANQTSLFKPENI